MDKFDTLQLFTRIVELGSFSQAADQLNIPRATASNAIKELESNLQCRLLERTTRHVRPSLDGQAFYERCTQILSELDDAESSLRNVIAQPRGLLRVDLSGAHATKIVLPNIDQFHELYPERFSAPTEQGDASADSRSTTSRRRNAVRASAEVFTPRKPGTCHIAPKPWPAPAHP